MIRTHRGPHAPREERFPTRTPVAAPNAGTHLAERDAYGSRRGATITELIVSMVVLSVALTSLAQLVSLSAQQRRVGEARRLALAELANQAERIAAISWEETAPEKLREWEPSADFAAAALSPVCKAQVTEEAGPPAARRIRLEVAWTPPGRQPVSPVSLTVWKFPAGDEP